MIAAVTYPRIRTSLVSALGTALDSLPRDVRRQLRGRWWWCITTIDDGRTVAHCDHNGVITFDPVFVGRLVDADQEGAIETLAAHELIHALRYVRGEAGNDSEAEERAVNRMMIDLGWGHDLRRLQQISGHTGG